MALLINKFKECIRHVLKHFLLWVGSFSIRHSNILLWKYTELSLEKYSTGHSTTSVDNKIFRRQSKSATQQISFNIDVTDFGRFQEEETCASMVGGFAVLARGYDMTVGFTTAAVQISA